MRRYGIFLSLALMQLAFSWSFPSNQKSKEDLRSEEQNQGPSEENQAFEEKGKRAAVPKPYPLADLPKIPDPSTRPTASGRGPLLRVVPSKAEGRVEGRRSGAPRPLAVGTHIPRPVEVVKPVRPVNVPQVDPSLFELQKQIQEIIQLNEALKVHRQIQTAEIHRIQEQARAHQRILGELQRPAAVKKGPSDARQELVGKEKVRLIQQETQRNSRRLKELAQVSESAS